MAGVTAPRFKSCPLALRFYFRTRELLNPHAQPGIFSRRRPTTISHQPNFLSDLIALDSCFEGLTDVQIWLLHQLYRPGCFDPRPRPLAQLLDGLRNKFPDRELTPHRVAQMKREALKIFEAHLVRERLL